MRYPDWNRAAAYLSGATIIIALGTAHGDVVSDQAAAIITYPYIASDTAHGIDTLIQLSNASINPVAVRCFYRTADLECHTRSFAVYLTSRQPIGWRASQGLSVFPLDQAPSNDQSNQGSSIPPVSGDPFTGSLQCIVVDTNGQPLGLNVLDGEATVEQSGSSPSPSFDATAYNAIGIPANPNAASSGSGALVLGGPSGGYSGCPEMLTATHFFDDALDPVTRTSTVSTSLILVSCSENLGDLTPRDVTVQYVVFNEFEQRFKTTAVMRGCEQAGRLSQIVGGDPAHSIFNVRVQGTLTGQTQVYAGGGDVGLLAVAVETHQSVEDAAHTKSAISNVHFSGVRAAADVILLPGLCMGDCNGNGSVTVDEILACVTGALDPSPVNPCPACDVNLSGQVEIDEILGSVNNALNGCPPSSE